MWMGWVSMIIGYCCIGISLMAGWREIPAIQGCYALMQTREEAKAELASVFEMIAAEYREKGQPLPADSTAIVNA